MILRKIMFAQRKLKEECINKNYKSMCTEEENLIWTIIIVHAVKYVS